MMKSLLKKFTFALLSTCLISLSVSAQDNVATPAEDVQLESVDEGDGWDDTDIWGEMVESQTNAIPGFANHLTRLCELSDQERTKLDAALGEALVEWKAEFKELGKKLTAIEKKYESGFSSSEEIEDEDAMLKIDEEISKLHQQSETMMDFVAYPKAVTAIKTSLPKEKFEIYKADIEKRKQREIDNTANLIVGWIDTKVGLSEDQAKYFISKLKSELGERLIKDDYALFDLGFSNSARFTPPLHEDDLSVGGVMVVVDAAGNTIGGDSDEEEEKSTNSLFDHFKKQA